MKKFTFIATLLLAFASLTANAGTRVLFNENYENSVAVSFTKWGSYGYSGGLSLLSDEFGKYMQVAGGPENQRSFYCNWGADIFNAEGLNADSYDINFDFCINAMGTNQYNSQFAICAGEVVEENYRTTNANPLFKIDQKVNSDDASTLTYYLNGDSINGDPWTPNTGTWYTFTLHVDKNARTVTYSAVDAAGEKVNLPGDGEYNLPDSVTDMTATHLWYADARYYNTVLFDNIRISTEVEGDWANEPVVALTGILADERSYTISFLQGETLHVTDTEGTTYDVEYDDCGGNFTEISTTTSGTITAYTTSGDATSDPVETTVTCEAITLPQPVATISAVKAGYTKDYTITVDKTVVELQPNVVFDYVFTPDDGSEGFSGAGLTSGSKVSLPSKGKLDLTSVAYGYTSNYSTVQNDGEYKVMALVDFQHMTSADLLNKGFTKMDNLCTSDLGGESNWTGRNRLYCQYNPVQQEDGSYSYTIAYPFGKGNAGPGIERYQFYQSNLDENAAANLFYPVKTWWNGDGVTTWDPTKTKASGAGGAVRCEAGVKGYTSNVKMYIGVGLVCPGVVNDDGSFDPMGVNYGNIINQDSPITIQGDWTHNDFIVVYQATNYGSESLHPQYDTTDEATAIANYKAENIGSYSTTYYGDERTFTLYRIQDAITRIEILSPVGGSTIYGDVNGDRYVNSADINAILNIMTGTSTEYKDKADVNGDKYVNSADINAVLDIMTGGKE